MLFVVLFCFFKGATCDHLLNRETCKCFDQQSPRRRNTKMFAEALLVTEKNTTGREVPYRTHGTRTLKRAQ